MGLRERFDAAADTVASVVSSLFVGAPDHPNRGGMTGEGKSRDAEDDRDVDDDTGSDSTDPEGRGE